MQNIPRCQRADVYVVKANLKMKLYLGLTETSPPDQTRVFVEVDGKLVDLSLAYAAYLAQAEGEEANAYELAAYYFPSTIAGFLERDEQARKALEQIVSFARKTAAGEMPGPTTGE